MTLYCRPEKKGGVDVDQVDTLRGQLTHHVQVVAPEQAIGLEFGMAELDALDHLERQIDGGEELAEALASIPAQWLLLDRHGAEADRWPPEFLLRRQCIRPLVPLLDLGRRNEIALHGTGCLFFVVLLWHYATSFIGGITSVLGRLTVIRLTRTGHGSGHGYRPWSSLRRYGREVLPRGYRSTVQRMRRQ